MNIIKNRHLISSFLFILIFGLIVSIGLKEVAFSDGGGPGPGDSSTADSDFSSLPDRLAESAQPPGPEGSGEGGGGDWWGDWWSPPPQSPCVPGAGSAWCISVPNSCGQTTPGTLQCNGSCSSSPPPDSNCPPVCTPSCGNWSSCSVSCGGGTQSQTCIASNCSPYVNTQSCNTHSCLPTATLKATPNIIYKGEFTTLKWTSQRADYADITNDVGSDIGRVGVNDEKQISPAETINYLITAINSYGVATAREIVTVLALPLPNVPTGGIPGGAPNCTFDANPGTLGAAGNTTLNWNCTNATYCEIDTSGGSGLGSSGELQARVNQTTTFNLVCGNSSYSKRFSKEVRIGFNIIEVLPD